MKAGLTEINGSLQPGGWLKLICGLTAIIPGLAPGPTIGNEYGKTLPFFTPDTVRRRAAPHKNTPDMNTPSLSVCSISMAYPV